MCHGSAETIYLLLSACPVLAASECLKHHNSVVSLVHKNLCSHLGVVTCDKPRLFVPESVIQVNEIKILWDFDIRTDHYIS